MKLLTWNVNGIRACLDKGLDAFFVTNDADVICLQEAKATPDQVDVGFLERMGYQFHWNTAEKKGYSGVVIASRLPVLGVHKGLGVDEHDREGRVLTAEFSDFYLVNVYTPNAQDGLRRLPYRQTWDRDFLAYLQNLEKAKPVIFGGDLNVAHKEIDIARPQENRFSPGFSDQERSGFDRIIEAGFIDTFREFDSSPGRYTWWSYRAGARARNVGWRIDYWMVSRSLKNRLRNTVIRPEIIGSDHCPVELYLD